MKNGSTSDNVDNEKGGVLHIVTAIRCHKMQNIVTMDNRVRTTLNVL